MRISSTLNPYGAEMTFTTGTISSYTINPRAQLTVYKGAYIGKEPHFLYGVKMA